VVAAAALRMGTTDVLSRKRIEMLTGGAPCAHCAVPQEMLELHKRLKLE